MKATLVRITGSKDPAMVVFGHPMQNSDNAVEFFWLIDECCDPSQCEYLEADIAGANIAIFWPAKNQFPHSSEMNEDASIIFSDLFEDNELVWKKIQPNLSEVYAIGNQKIQ